ncbi:hypothetical protein [Pyrodictium abyssi]|uniref:Integral membrane protein n=1 Tax=Pyrodictium abyssi TaxID=54256 RepID=A0ABN6ZNY4_9CREN|nr:hypothetical protein PABY_15240 [Pyrodictium abyssi]
MAEAAPLLAVAAALAGLYAALTERDERMLLSSTAALVFLALLFLDMGEPAAAIVQLSLAGGFLAAAGFLAPELGGVKRGAVPGLGVAGALVLLVVLVHLGSRVEPPNPRLEEWAPLAVAMASAPLASVLLALRLVIGGGSRGD